MLDVFIGRSANGYIRNRNAILIDHCEKDVSGTWLSIISGTKGTEIPVEALEICSNTDIFQFINLHAYVVYIIISGGIAPVSDSPESFPVRIEFGNKKELLIPLATNDNP